MPSLNTYALSGTAVKLSAPSGVDDADDVGGLFITPSTVTVGLGVAGTTFADAVHLPSATPIKIEASDPPYAVLQSGETYTLSVLWSGKGV